MRRDPEMATAFTNSFNHRSVIRNVLLMTMYLFISIWSSFAYSIDTSYITPTYIRIITNPYEQYNDVNPSWSSNGEFISFERYDMNTHEIILSDKTGKKLQTIIAQGKKESELDMLFSTEEDVTSYNTGISWSPNHDEFVFVSSGKSNNFDLFIGKTGTEKTRRLTFHAHKDNQAKWSPINDDILFVSAREGYAGLFKINSTSKKITQLLDEKFDILHPVWSPDGEKIALMIGVDGLYQIYVINDIKNPESSLTLISAKSRHNIRPSWSPNGNGVSYFSSTESNTWNINVASVSNTDQEKHTEKTVAFDVIQNSSEGPTWLPDSKNIAYIKNENNSYNPIYIVDTNSDKHGLLLTNTKMNFDLSCSSDGILVFQTQDRQWSRIYIAAIPGFKG